MAQTDNKMLILGALAGVAGIGLAVVCYRSLNSKRRSSWPGFYHNRTNIHEPGLTLVDGPGLPNEQAAVLQRLEALIQCVSELKDEMKALKTALPALQDHVREELRGHSSTHRASPLHRTRRRRTAGTTSRAEGQSSEDAESEGGYMTALTDSEDEEFSEEEQSCEERAEDELAVLLQRIDRLRQGGESEKRESLDILLEQKDQFGQNSAFLWRLTRAYCDVHDACCLLEEKKTLAERGKQVGEEAICLNPRCAESHQWYAIMCGILAEYDTIQNKIKNGYIFKDHLDKAIELKPQDPLSYYLLGRWCYAVAQLSWIERKVAATLFGEPPSATIEDALKNFLKVEELHPAYSKLNYVFLAKCYKYLGQMEKARQMCEAACSMDNVSKERMMTYDAEKLVPR
ncbi:regulator of microtubule dynamics protein 2 isoform X2 [Kryptolebias marmoratus]|uniref:regulator of microtubule dynamics protein 2 isoform X2 n=1 Tax=Kryptolebias marmoratus TaxID=37003 RepID=UPI0018ACD90C|nr:regulator of microtubule dynamics protein 2 isoform X2 [Kryptolebias marmoratus]